MIKDNIFQRENLNILDDLKSRTISEKSDTDISVGELVEFDQKNDMDFFYSIDGDNAWIALEMDNCINERYFVVLGKNKEKLGIVGVYDTADEESISHIVINPEYRSKKIGKSLLPEFYNELLKKTGLKEVFATVNPDNFASVSSHERAGFVKIDDPHYDWKIKYSYSLK